VFSAKIRAAILVCLRTVFHRSSFQNRAGKYIQIFEGNLRSGDFSLLTFFAWQAKKVDICLSQNHEGFCILFGVKKYKEDLR
jgi:hypothetical protein